MATLVSPETFAFEREAETFDEYTQKVFSQVKTIDFPSILLVLVRRSINNIEKYET